jgi:hypothetical protein
MFCKRFLHVHIPRCGGSLVRSLVQELLINTGKLPDVVQDTHAPLAGGRELFPDAPAFTFVRNMWDWRVSLWSRHVETGKCCVSFGDWLKDSPGFTSWWHHLGAEKVRDNLVGRFEKLGVEIRRIFHILIPDLLTDEEILMAIARIGPVRSSTWHVPWPWLYKEMWMVDHVYEQDRELIERFGYEFPFEDSISYGPGSPEGLKSGLLLSLLKESLEPR